MIDLSDVWWLYSDILMIFWSSEFEFVWSVKIVEGSCVFADLDICVCVCDAVLGNEDPVWQLG